MDIVEEAKKASVAVYLVTEESVAADLSEILNGLVAEIERLRGNINILKLQRDAARETLLQETQESE